MAEVGARKQEFVDKLLHEPEKNYYAAVKKLAWPGSKKAWSVLVVFPGRQPLQVGQEVPL